MAIFDILDQGMSGLSSLGSSFFGGDEDDFSREKLQAEFEQQIKGIEEARMAPVSEEEREKLEDQFYAQKLKDLDKEEPAKDYSAYKAPKQQSTRPSSITAPKPSLGSPSFRAIDDRAYSQIQRGLNIVDLNKLLDEAMGTRAKVNVFNSLFGGRGLL